MTEEPLRARTYPPGVTCWIDLEVDDVEEAHRFYGGLLGWTFETATPPGVPPYTIALLDGADVGGIGTRPPDRDVTGWNTYVAVDDLDTAIASVQSAGGSLVDPKEQAGEGGWNATVADPTGVRFRLWQARRRLGSQVVNQPGAWNFSDLHTDASAAAAAFYGSVFGWRVVEMGPLRMIQVPDYGDHLAATVDPDIHQRQASAPPGFADVIGGIAPVDDADGLGAHWHVTLSVADRDESAATAESLGGTVLGTSEDLWTRKAVVRDPQGAVFTASQFTPPDRG